MIARPRRLIEASEETDLRMPPTSVADAGRTEGLVAERAQQGIPGWPVLGIGLALILVGVALLASGPVLTVHNGGNRVAAILILLGLAGLAGLTAIAPGEARVIQLFGGYRGTIRRSGLRWVNPLAKRRKVSTRIRNHETAPAKVNDADGNPIEIAAVVVWQVRDTAGALYEVDDFVAFVGFQAETAVRHVATSYPYDSHGDGPPSLRDHAEEITAELSTEIAARVASAGVEVIESRITRLSYAPEIAQAMLRRQQAGAVVAARKRIVEGAVGMVELALERLEKQHIVELDDERKAAMVSNLLVVLCSDQATQPVVNTGSLYH
jgi:regulator of protease activity HflC (stomatin/prohibitin superfamily)